MKNEFKKGILQLNWQKTFVDRLPGDKEESNFVRQIKHACYSFVKPQKFPSPSVVIVSKSVCHLLGISDEEIKSDEFLQIFSGQMQVNDIKSWACCYGGHQFGSWANQLGDGRAITIGELKNDRGQLFDIQLKGSGRTPYSRFADGKAVLRSCLREYLCSEAMFYLNIPTTRALGVFKTGEKIVRDILYDGNPAPEDGAILVRVSESLIRFGTFEIFAVQDNPTLIKLILDYSIERNFPQLKNMSEPDKYFQWFQTVVDSTAKVIAKWQGVGFVHGVLNTDNMSVLGETIDYGPFGFMEEFEPEWTPNTTDKHYRRYTYENQPEIGQWNITKLGNALLAFLKNAARIKEIISTYKQSFKEQHYLVFKEKLGFESMSIEDFTDLFKQLKPLLVVSKMDHTMFYRLFAEFDIFAFQENRMDDFLERFSDCSYNPTFLTSHLENWSSFLSNYKEFLRKEQSNFQKRKQMMLLANPKYIIRNWQLQECINQTSEGNLEMLHELDEMIRHPFDENPKFEKYFQKRPDWAKKLPGYSMLSCSS